MASSRRTAALFLSLLAATSGVVGADGLVESGSLAGRVTGSAAPLASAAVYAYQLADFKLWKGVTDEQGRFRFESLPAGLYKIIAAKSGFLPAIVHLTRGSANHHQYVDLELREGPVEGSSTANFWSVREQIPPDVLRDLGLIEGGSPRPADGEPEVQLAARLLALTGVSQGFNGDTPSQLTGGRLDVEGEIRNIRLGIEGDFSQLQSLTGQSLGLSGRTQAMTVNLEGMGSGRVELSSVSNRLRMDGSLPEIGLESHRVSWSQPLGEGVSQFAAQYTQESNFYSTGLWAPHAAPLASRSWRLEGSFLTDLTERSSFETGFRYLERESQYGRDREALLSPDEQIELYGRGGLQVSPGLLVEYGLYSTLRDGTVWLSPRGGLVLKLGRQWQAGSVVTSRFRADGDELLRQYFTPVYFADSTPCEQGEELCYQLYLRRNGSGDGSLSIGATHRRYAETLRLYFDDDFYNFFESLYLVEGDELPELKLEFQHRLSPGVLTRFESSVAAGGGGVLTAADRSRYENQVRYMVTSLDTHFERTSTGVFLAFHQLAQELSPMHRRNLRHADMELERVQLLLTQDLDFLQRVASDLALQLNMEISRGSLPAGRQYEDPDEIRRRITGGLSVRF